MRMAQVEGWDKTQAAGKPSASSDAACERRPVPGESQGAFAAPTKLFIGRNSITCIIDEVRTSRLCPELGEQPSPSGAGG